MDWHDYFTYDPETGNLIWKERPRGHFKSAQAHSASNTKFAGLAAGTLTLSGRGFKQHTLFLMGKRQKTSRIIWEMHYGPIPEGMLIDHKDRDPSNNRLSNLRLATHEQNRHNSAKRKTDRPHTGVYPRPMKNGAMRWGSIIANGGKRKSLGSFDTIEEAKAAYDEVAMRNRGEFIPKATATC